MNLVIHDLPPDIWQSIAPRYAGCHVLGPSTEIQPCTACFGCWMVTPGRCLLKDGFDVIAPWFNEASEITFISRCTFGGFSGFVKNCMDRCGGSVLPLFEVDCGEMLHKARFHDVKYLHFRYWGRDLSEDERELARDFSKAYARACRTRCKEIVFDDFDIKSPEKTASTVPVEADKTVMVNFSLRQESNTSTFLHELAKILPGGCPIYQMRDYLDRQDELLDILLSSSRIVLGMPMYVCGMPSPAVRILERLENIVCECPKKIYALTNRGMYESRNLRNVMAMIKTWCRRSGHYYCGGLAIGAAEMQGRLIHHIPMGKGPLKYVGEGMVELADAIKDGIAIEDVYAEPAYASRFLYIFMANRGWMKMAKDKGMTKKELFKAEKDDELLDY